MTAPSHPTHPLIVLWCHPRSMSTATERIMRERGDLRCYHEPLMYHYYVGRSERTMPHFDVDPEHPKDFRSIWDMLLDAAREQAVFVKDMAYYVWPEFQNHTALASMVRHVFLIRDPRRAIVSYHRLDPNVTSDEIGYEAQWRLAEWVANTTGYRPPVIEAEVIQANPKATMRALWQALGLEDRPGALDWSDETPKDWQQVSGWHDGAIQSRGIRPPDKSGDAHTQFEAAAAAAPHLREFLAHHEPFYRALKDWSGTATEQK